MKRFLILLLVLLLTGCAAVPATSTDPAEPSATATTTTQVTVPPETTEAPTETTAPPETVPPDPLEVLLAEMTAEEKVGQLFLARCPDMNAVADIQNYHL